jgi:hypothetical protein
MSQCQSEKLKSLVKRTKEKIVVRPNTTNATNNRKRYVWTGHVIFGMLRQDTEFYLGFFFFIKSLLFQPTTTPSF